VLNELFKYSILSLTSNLLDGLVVVSEFSLVRQLEVGTCSRDFLFLDIFSKFYSEIRV